MIILPQYNTKTPGPKDCDNLETELKFYLLPYQTCTHIADLGVVGVWTWSSNKSSRQGILEPVLLFPALLSDPTNHQAPKPKPSGSECWAYLDIPRTSCFPLCLVISLPSKPH